jgi:predicted MFS family arabinose efflux permease
VSGGARLGGSPWIPISGGPLAVGLSYLVIFAVPPLITTFVDDLGLSHSQAGALMSVCLGGFLVSSFFSGRLARRFGPVPVIVAGLVLCGIASICFGLAESLPAWLVCRAAIGVAGGLIYAPGVTFVTSLLPPARANIGVGVFLCGLSIGGTVAFFATRLLADALDWRWPSWIYGAACLAGAAVVLVVSGPSSPRGSRAIAAAGTPLRKLFASRPFALLLLCLFGGLFVAYGVFTWIPPYLDESAGFSTAQISLVSALMTLVGIPATFGFGWLADRGARPLLLASVGLALPVLLVVFALTTTPPPGLAAIVAAAAAFGISGGLAPLYALPPVLFGAAGGATASGIAASSAMAGAVTSTYLGGWIVGATDGYDVAFWIYAVAAGAAGFVLVPLVAASLGRVRSVTAPER